ncbi:MAG: SAF domain-containing protein [Angelakisella sp.]
MFGLSEDFLRLEREGKPIRVAIIGVGQMGRSLVAQMVPMNGISPVVIIDHRAERVIAALSKVGVKESGYALVTTAEQADAAVAQGKIAIAEDDRVATACGAVQVVIDATGALADAARIALDAFANKKHIIMMTVETDVVVGPLLNRKAKEAGVIFTGMAGDEPGVIMELYDFAKTMGLEVLVLGKGKNNEVNYSANPDTAAAEAAGKEMNPRMLASFQDCTKTMVELAAVSNATGFLPDCIGAHGVTATAQTLASVYRLKEEGGVLNNYGVVDYVKGIAPGVFAVVTTKDEEIRKELAYLSMGDGPNYTFYRPYHLCSLEVPMTVGRLMLYGKPSLVPMAGAPHAEVVAFAKRDLAAGEHLDGIGGYTVYGAIASAKKAAELGALPVGLVNGNTVMKKAIKKGEIITYEHVKLDEASLLVKLRREQDKLMAEGVL